MTLGKLERRKTDTPPIPPFRPDPEIIGNIEGNRRIRDEEREAARRYLDDHDLRAPADDSIASPE